MNPLKYAQMMRYLTRVKKQKPDLPDVFPASKAPIPPKTQNVEEIEAINRFIRSERQQKAGGGMLVQPGFSGVRQGYSGKGPGSTFAKNINKEFDLTKVNELRKKGKTIDEIAKAFNSTKSRYEAFVTLNKNKLVPVDRAKQMGKGAFSLAELNRVARIKYPKIGNYAKLNTKQKSNVRSNLQYSSVAGTKITKKTFLTPLTEIQQNKILAEFPDADFSIGKFGFTKATNNTKLAQVKAFIKRGYKPKFKSLPLKVQNQIKEKFSEITEWDFKKYKYGIPQTFKASENRKIAMRIKNFVADPKPFMFAFSFDRPGAWMVQQMYRAWEHGNTDYEPIYNKNNKVIGMKEKGKAYYANENVVPSKKFKLINSHPEFDKVQKFVDVANEAKLPLKDLSGYKNTKALMALFPEGYESVKFSDLVNYLYQEQGADVTRNAIEKHHLKNISDMGAPVESKNLQLLRQDLNTLGNTITQQIKEGDFSRVGDLEKAGVKITVDGKTYGKGFQDPRRQLNRIIGDVTQKVSSLDEKQFNNLLAKIGCPGLASGGRAGFDVGTNCQIKGANLINSGMKNASPAQLKNFAAFANRAASLGRGVMKYGVIPEALYVAADSVIRMGMGDNFNEAFLRATQYLSPFDNVKKAEMLEADRFFGPEIAGIIGKSIDYKNELAKVQSLEDQKANLENLSGGGEFDYIGDLSQDVKNIDAQLKQATDNLNNKFKITDAERIYAERMQDEVDDARSAGSFFTKLKSKFRDVEPDSDIETLGVPEKTQADLNKKMLPQAPTIYKIENGKIIKKNLSEANTTEIRNHVKLLKSVGVKDSTRNLLEQQKYLRGMPLSEQEQLFGKEATYGASGTMGEPINKPVFKRPQNIISDIEREAVGQTNVANPFDIDISDIGTGLRGFAAAGGGIAKEAGDSSGPPPESGPNSQGLQGLMKRVRNL